MRLLVITQYFWPENFRINDLVAELVRRGHSVTVLTGYPNYPDGEIFAEYSKNPSDFMDYCGARVVRVPLFPRGKGGARLLLNYFSFVLTASFGGLWKLRGQEFDAIFVCQLSPVLVGIPAAVMKLFKRAPILFWILDLWPDTLKAIGVVRSEKMSNLVGKLVAWIYRRCDYILVQSNSFIERVKACEKSPLLIEYFPSWAENVFLIGAHEQAPEIKKRENGFDIVFAGNIGEAQDFPSVLSAAEILKQNKNIRWFIVGDGRMAQWVKDEIFRRGLENNVFLLGRFPLERMPSFYKSADALLVSLKDEAIFSMTIPGKLQSYLASGIPVLAMLNGEGADLVRRSAAGLVCPAGDFKQLADSVLTLSEARIEDRILMGQNGRNLCRQEFDRAKLLDKLEVLLNRAVEGCKLNAL